MRKLRIYFEGFWPGMDMCDNFITRNEFDDLKAKYEELERQMKSSNKPAVRKKEVTENE